MSDLSPINAGRISRPDRIRTESSRPAEARPEDPRGPSPRSNDRVEISPNAALLSKLRTEPSVRQDLVERVKEEIANGTYETEGKIDAALELIKEDLELELNLED